MQSLGMPRDDDDAALLEQLRAGEEKAFVVLVKRYHNRLTRLALTFVPSPEMAEDVAQETWLAVFRGVGRFEGRSSLRTWLFQICANRARSLAEREQRIASVGEPERAVDPGRFGSEGGRSCPPQHWADAVDDRIEAGELAVHVLRAIEELPEAQRQVVTLRDIEGLTSLKVCEVLSLSEPNQRVLLHRGRSRIRRTLDEVTQR